MDTAPHAALQPFSQGTPNTRRAQQRSAGRHKTQLLPRGLPSTKRSPPIMSVPSASAPWHWSQSDRARKAWQRSRSWPAVSSSWWWPSGWLLASARKPPSMAVEQAGSVRMSRAACASRAPRWPYAGRRAQSDSTRRSAVPGLGAGVWAVPLLPGLPSPPPDGCTREEEEEAHRTSARRAEGCRLPAAFHDMTHCANTYGLHQWCRLACTVGPLSRHRTLPTNRVSAAAMPNFR